MPIHPQRTTRMTGRERVMRMFARQDQDSVPRCDSLWVETHERFRKEGLTIDFADFLGQDFQGVGWVDPKAYPGQNLTVSEDDLTRTYRDEWNNTVRYWKNRSGTPEHVAFGCPDRETWEEDIKPRLIAVGSVFNRAQNAQQYVSGRRCGRWIHFNGLETFESTRRILGDEITMMALVEDPEWIVDVSQVTTTISIETFEAQWNAGCEVDGLWIYGDMAYRGGTMCSPAMYKEYIWPDHKRLADWAHSKGIPIIYHTDGNVNAVIDLYLEAGFDAFQPIEVKAGMDIRDLIPRTAGKMAFIGNVDVMAMSTNDREIVEAELLSKLRAGMEMNGYAYHSDHSVPPAVSFETYCFVVELLDRYGNYD